MRCIYLRIEDFVADRIINLCNKQHITMYRLAQISGLKQSTISNIMKRGTLPNLITLEKICIGFGITMSQFFQEKEECLNLTTQQKEIINIWIDLDEEKRELFYNILLGMKNSGWWFFWLGRSEIVLKYEYFWKCLNAVISIISMEISGYIWYVLLSYGSVWVLGRPVLFIAGILMQRAMKVLEESQLYQKNKKCRKNKKIVFWNWFLCINVL